MNTLTPTWLLLIVSLPSDSATARMRIWRALKNLGCGALRDGAYLLPYSVTSRKLLEEQEAEIKAAGGVAHLLHFQADSPEQRAQFVALLDRTEEYAELIRRASSCASANCRLDLLGGIAVFDLTILAGGGDLIFGREHQNALPN